MAIGIEIGGGGEVGPGAIPTAIGGGESGGGIGARRREIGELRRGIGVLRRSSGSGSRWRRGMEELIIRDLLKDMKKW